MRDVCHVHGDGNNLFIFKREKLQRDAASVVPQRQIIFSILKFICESNHWNFEHSAPIYGLILNDV